MKQLFQRYGKYVLLGIIAVGIATFLPKRKAKEGKPRSYVEIQRSGVLRAVTEYNSISYYVDEDTLSGFHYALIQAFAHDKRLKLELIPEMNFDKQLQGLENGTYDLIAYGIATTSEWKDSILLTSPLVRNTQVLVQRKKGSPTAPFIRSQIELAGRTLHVSKSSPTLLRIRNLGYEIGDTIYVKEMEGYGSEQLMALVAHGDIDYAVCNNELATALIDSFPQLDIHTGISFNQFYSWGVSKQQADLRDTLNHWLGGFLKTEEYKKIYKQYHH